MASQICFCNHPIEQHQRESLLCQHRDCPCQLFKQRQLLKPGTPFYAQARNNLIVALDAMRARAAKAQEHALELGLEQLANDCGLYVEDIAAQIANVNETQRRPNVAYAEL